MIKKLLIENFKGISKLDLNGLKNVTLLAGNNHVGKSTVLEAVMLLHSPQFSSQLLPNIVHRENIGREPEFDLAISGLFYKFNMANKIKIVCDTISMTIDYEENCKYKIGGIPDQPGLTIDVQSPGLLIQYVNNILKKTTFEIKAVKFIQNMDKYTTIFEQPNHLVSITPDNVIFINECSRLSRKNSLYFNAQQDFTVYEFGLMRDDEAKKKSLISAMQIIDSQIIDIIIGVDVSISNSNIKLTKIYIKKEGISKTFALSTLGQGIKKIFNIVCGIINNPDGILVIDEIENGIHYSRIQKMWEIIFKLSKEHKCQVIATTHSYEMASYITKIDNIEGKDFSFIKIFDDFEYSLYSFEKLQSAIKRGLELR